MNYKTKLRQTLRNNPTLPESKLWQRLRSKQLGFKFRRQHSLGDYIVDFYCVELKLAIEIDGDSHFTEQGLSKDILRTQYLNSIGVSVIRFTNLDVMENLDGVVESIFIVITERKALP